MKLVGWLGSTLGGTITGWFGWWIASSGGFFVAFIVSMIFTGFGLYYGRKWALRLVGM
jgi:hypothetical protein